jgi:transitional endoplasmic reticulum ATPase
VLLDEVGQSADESSAVLDCADRVADLLQLTDFDRDLLRVTVAFNRLPRLSALRTRLTGAQARLLDLMGRLSGASAGEAEARVRRSSLLSLGLVVIERDYGGIADLQLHYRFGNLIDGGSLDEDALIDALAGIRQRSVLRREDFPEHARAFDLVVRLLKGAATCGAPGVNVLIHGPPGTGKTEFARAVAAEAGLTLFAVGEADSDGEEPTRLERLQSLNRAQRLLARRTDSLLLFDELEDLFAEASISSDGARRSGSKIFVNRLLEKVAVPVIWTSNSLAPVDDAHLRRFSFILKMPFPSPRARQRIAARAAVATGAEAMVPALTGLLEREQESASVSACALRSAALAGGKAEDAELAARSLLEGLRGGRRLSPSNKQGPLDLSLYVADIDIARLMSRLSSPETPDGFSLLLSGPPGTGKTALAAEVADRLDRPLAVKRSSDLLSKWLGQTEANIAEAFAEARESGAVLLFDEADSLLNDRADAKQSWEVTQVNELLTWMDGHPLPFVAATNFVRRIDPAAFRRFVFKIELEPLTGESLRRAFRRFFDEEPPAALLQLQGLTPGDFAVVRRQLRYAAAGKADIVGLLAAEARAKPGSPARLGF